MFSSDFKLGILGGGQLGKMLCLSAHNWDLQTYVLDADTSFPASGIATHFIQGSFKKFEDVFAFGKDMDVLTIEIEHINLEALEALENAGVVIHPKPSALKIIQDKGLQKQFFQDYALPTAPFQLFKSPKDIVFEKPFVWKSRKEGYDGKGVSLVLNAETLATLPDVPCLAETLVPIQKELAVIAARNANGEIKCFPAVEMVFHPTANLVEYLFCPANISSEIAQKAEDLAIRTIEALEVCGLLAVELFLDDNSELLLNEVAPRPHNSGHHTIDACVTSQFEQHLRGVLNLPLGDTSLKMPVAMVNILGAEGYKGDVKYQGVQEALAIEGAKLHLYSKKQTAPFRKMGHATILNEDLPTAIENAKAFQQVLKVMSETAV